MKPLPSERQLLVGVAGAVLAHPQDSVLLGGEGEVRHSWKKSHTNHFLCHKAGPVAISVHPQGPASDL